MSKESSVENSKRTIGTLGLEKTLYQNTGRIRYDEVGKKVLSYKEVLANILKYTIPEYTEYSTFEIMNFIDGDSILNCVPIEPDTDTRVKSDNTVMSAIGEANLTFDVLFNVLHPSKNKVHLHVDVELQGKYNPGYPIEKRGIYNMSRMISSQLDVVNQQTNYNKLEKVYSIFICVGGVPQYLWNTVSYYEFANKKNVGKVKPDKENYDLMNLVIVRIGEFVPEKVAEIIRFLHGVFYDIDEVRDYIDFSKNEKLRKEIENMAINGDHLIEYGIHLEQEKTRQLLKEKTDIIKKQADEISELREQLMEIEKQHKKEE